MKKIFAALVLSSIAAVIATPALAAADTYVIDGHHTFPIFEVDHLGFSTQRGRFNKTTGKIMLDTAAKQGSIDLTIDVASLDMGFPTWDEHMAAEGFFNTQNFPTMTFKSNKLIFDGDKIVAAEGEFTLLGVTKPLRLTVTNFKCGAHPFTKQPMCGGTISASLKRSDYGMTKALPAVGDEVRISSGVEALKDVRE